MSVLDRLPRVLSAVAPNLSTGEVSTWTDALVGPMQESAIVTPYRVAAFIGTVAVESARFTTTVENGNFSALRICQVWPERFPSEAAAEPYAHNPQRLFNLVYADRMGNGSVDSGDGNLCCGRGLIQITGRARYEELAEAMHKTFDETVSWMGSAAGAAVSAVWFWMLPEHKPSLNKLADAWNLTAICRAVNGGENGLLDRISLSTRALEVFGA